MHLLEIRHLLLVAAVADEGNLTRAGSRLNLTQSALSHQLLDIEERLGTPLFHRLNRTMKLTDAGERLLTSARRVLEDLTNTEEDLKLYASDRRGIIRMSTECYTTYHWLPQLMRDFEQMYPHIEIRIDARATANTSAAILEGQIDLALMLEQEVERGIATRPLFEDEMLVVVSPEHRFLDRPYVKPSDFEEETLITYGDLDDTTIYERLLRPAGVQPKKSIAVGLTEAIIEMVKNGLGIGVMAGWAVMPHINAGLLVGLPLTRRGFTRKWQIAHAAGRQLPAYCTALIDLLSLHGGRLAEMSGRAVRAAAMAREASSTMVELAGDAHPLHVLQATPSELATLVGGLSDAAARRPESPGKWSILQVVQHLADSEVVDAWRYRQTIAQQDALLSPYDQDKWLSRVWSPDTTVQTALEEFQAMRASNLRVLRELPESAWESSAVHAERGRESLRLMARIAAGHDLQHMRQIERIRRAVAA